MGVKLEQAPVFYTLAQVKFNPIAQIKEDVPKLQDMLRRKGYPDFREEVLTAIDVRRLEKEQPDIKSQQNLRWSFSNFDRTEGYLLTSDALVFHTTSYNSHADFLEKLIHGLDLVHEVLSLDYVERIGLRYLNAVIPKSEKTLADYLSPTLLGFSSIIQGSLKHNFSEVMADTSNGTLVARAIIINDGLALPPDLSPMPLVMHPKFSTLSGKIATLDIDHFSNNRFSFDTQLIKTNLLSLHDTIDATFNASVTEYAFECWR